MKISLNIAMQDIKEAIALKNIWLALGWNDVKARYRRSALGPWWLTISMAITLGIMGPLYGSLFRVPASEFIPYLALGFIIWGFVSSAINDYCEAFTQSEHFLKQMWFPLTLFIFRVYWRQFIMFAHNIILYPIILLIFGKGLNAYFFLAIPGLVVTSLNIISIGIIVAIFCTRYRDMRPVVGSLIALLFFITPIVWRVEQLPETRKFFATINPFTSLLEIVRAPMQGNLPDNQYWIIAIGLTTITTIFALLLLSRFRHRVTYWL